MDDLKRTYMQMPATLYREAEAWLDEFGARGVWPPVRREHMWSRFEALRQRFAVLKRDATEQLAGTGTHDPHPTAVRLPLPTRAHARRRARRRGWETHVRSDVIEAESRICEEAQQVERWS